MSPPPLVPLSLAPPDVVTHRAGDGALVLEAAAPLGAVPDSLGTWLAEWAEAAPDRTLFAAREGDGWKELSYATAWSEARRIGQGLLDRGLGPDRPLMLLTGNGLDHARLTLGALVAGIPVAPVSPGWSTASTTFARLEAVFDRVNPGLIWAEDDRSTTDALASLPLRDTLVVTGAAEQLEHQPTAVVDAAFDAITPDTVAKILFTSGSTGIPKAVINTHRMLAANQQMIAQVWPFLAEEPPVLVDWLPWHHTFGGNHNVNMVLRNGGTLYIDDGRPLPGRIERTVDALRQVSPTLYFNVPVGYHALLPALEQDAELARHFFARLRLIFYAGAALSQDLWERLDAVALRTLGQGVLLTTAWGSTETAPLATAAHFPLERAGNIGVPAPGVSLKLAPVADRLELRLRGPNVTPGYLGDEAATAAAFDDEGYLRTGDAGVLADPDNPSAGILFRGRITEDFKLSSGTWVEGGKLRLDVVSAAAPLVRDVVVGGENRAWVGLLVWLDEAACATLAQGGAAADSAAVQQAVRDALRRYNAAVGIPSRRVRRALLLSAPPDPEANEINDKGYVNQRRVLERRSAAVTALYAEPPAPDVLVL